MKISLFMYLFVCLFVYLFVEITSFALSEPEPEPEPESDLVRGQPPYSWVVVTKLVFYEMVTSRFDLIVR